MKKLRISHPQKRILESELFIENTSLNNIPDEMDFPREAETSVRKIIEFLIQTTPDLNIRFSLGETGEMTQYVGEPDLTCIQTIRFESDSQSSEKIRTLSAQPFEKIFDAPLYRFYLIDTGKSLRLLVVIHHAVCDGTSVNILFAKIAELFILADQPQNWTALQSNTFSYLDLEQNYLNSAQMELDRKFWLDYLAEAEELPEKKNDPNSYEADNYVLELDQALTDKLSDYLTSFKKPISPFSFMLALTGLYFGRVNNENRSLMAMGYANRNHGDLLANSLGMYVSTVPIKQHFEVNEPFESFLQNSKSSMKEALSHSQYPLDLLMGELSDEVSGKLLDVTIVSNSAPKSEVPKQFIPLETSIGGVTIRVNPLKDDRDGLQSLHIEYKKSVYDKSRIEEMARAFVHMIEQIMENPKALCAEIEVVSKEEQDKLLKSFNDTAMPVGDSVVAMFKEQAQTRPDQVAVIYNDVSLTYGEVDAITNKIAAKLLQDGLKEEEPVGVMIDRSEYMVLFPLAVLKAGGAYMPLDHAFPEERLEYMIEDAGVTTILSEDTKPEDHIPFFKGKVYKKEEIDSWDAADDLSLPIPQKDHKFVVLYTSGSTGKPKGCVLEHGNLANFCSWFSDYYRLTPDDRGGAYASFGFDAHMMDTYPYITCGSCVCIIPADIRLDFIKLNEYYENNQINYAFMTTQLGRQFVQEIDNHSLKVLTIGGEKLPSIKLPTYDLFHAYGPTECTIFTTARKFKTEHDCLLVGKPIGNYKLFVLDKNLM
ncbi:MAG: hypothetical protein PWP62_1297 [Eubacteriaceae bacterium]|jgi:non-ribosomal peptide synthetase component F|nr:hypothetical protein [Eubacteriaceae bacterium]